MLEVSDTLGQIDSFSLLHFKFESLKWYSAFKSTIPICFAVVIPSPLPFLTEQIICLQNFLSAHPSYPHIRPAVVTEGRSRRRFQFWEAGGRAWFRRAMVSISSHSFFSVKMIHVRGWEVKVSYQLYLASLSLTTAFHLNSLQRSAFPPPALLREVYSDVPHQTRPLTCVSWFLLSNMFWKRCQIQLCLNYWKGLNWGGCGH